MDMIIKNRNGKVSERQRQHIEEKLGKLGRYLPDIQSFTVELSSQHHRDNGDTHRMQVTMVGEHGVILRADKSAPDLFAATDQVQDVLQRQIRRYKDRHWRRGKLRHTGTAFVEPDLPPVEQSSDPVMVGDLEEPHHILRVKEFTLRPMHSDEAVEQMELLGHTFFVFRDAQTERVSVVYRRNDGNYGLIIPVED